MSVSDINADTTTTVTVNLLSNTKTIDTLNFKVYVDYTKTANISVVGHQLLGLENETPNVYSKDAVIFTGQLSYITQSNAGRYEFAQCKGKVVRV